MTKREFTAAKLALNLRDEFYLGDGVYVGHDGVAVWLRTERESGWHEIALEPNMIDILAAYVTRLRKRAAAEETTP